MAHAYAAGAAGMPCAFFRGYLGSDLPRVNPNIKSIDVPVHGRGARRGAGAPARRHDHSRAEGRSRRQRAGRRHRRRAEGGGARRAAGDRHGRGNGRRPRSRPAPMPSSCRRGRSARSSSSPAARGRRTRTATTRATTRSTSRGTRSRAIARRSSAGSGRMRSGRPIRACRRRDADDVIPASEMMTVAAARALGNDDICFVGIGLPSAACNLARLTHAPRLTLVYESGTLETQAARAAAVDRRRRAVRDGADDRVGAGDVPVLAAGRADHASGSSAARRSIGSAI